MPDLMKGNQWHERCRAKKRNGDTVVTYPVYVEDKHDEIRCHVKILTSLNTNIHPKNRVLFLSYAGKPLANMEQFAHIFYKLYSSTGYSEFDMGFECNENFNDSYRWVRSTKGVPSDLTDATFKFYIFGLPGKNVPMYRQMQMRLEVVAYAKDWVSVPVLVPFFQTATNEHDVDQMFAFARSRGREGVMVKQPHALYERKRTDGWLKMKPEADADGVITSVNCAFALDGTRLARAGSVTVQMSDGSVARPSGIAHELAADMWLHPEKYVGEWCTFIYMERDRQDGYRHPTWGRLREAK